MNKEKLLSANQKEDTQYLTACFNEQMGLLHSTESRSSC